MKRMENIEAAKLEAVKAFLHLFQALDNLDVLDDLTKAVEEQMREENADGQS